MARCPHMKTLHVCMEAPFPPRSGGTLRNAAVSRALSSLGPVTCVSMAADAAGPAPAGILLRSLKSTAGRNVWTFNRPDFPTVMETDRATRAELGGILKETAADLLVLEGVTLLEAAESLADAGVPIVIDMHNIESQLLPQSLRSRPLRKRLLSPRNIAAAVRAAERADRRAAQIASQIWVCSEEDGRLLAGLHANANMQIVRNPIPDEEALSIEITPDRYRRVNIAYVGHLSYFPNVDAVNVLLSQVAPLLAQTGTAFSVSIIGGGPGRTARRICRRSGARLIADPPEVTSHLQAMSYAAMPIRYGGGTRLKALEALAAGLVVVATAKAVEGLGLVPDLHYLRCETPQSMAEAIESLARAPDRAAAIAQEGRRFVMEKHSFSAIEAQVQRAVFDLKVP